MRNMTNQSHIVTTNGYKVFVDCADLELVSGYSWHAAKHARAHTRYAQTNIKGADGKHRSLLMHRLILDPPKGMVVDHVDMDGLNNTRANIRVCTKGESQRNRRNAETSAIPYKGVSFVKHAKKYKANIKVDYKYIVIGHFSTAIDAAKAYDDMALKLHGEYASLNFKV